MIFRAALTKRITPPPPVARNTPSTHRRLAPRSGGGRGFAHGPLVGCGFMEIQAVSAQEYLNSGNTNASPGESPRDLTRDQKSLGIQRAAGRQWQSLRGASRAMGMEDAVFRALKVPAGQQLAP